MHTKGTQVKYERPGLPHGTGVVEATKAAHGDRIMHQVRDARGNVFWFPEDALAEANS